MVQNILRRTEIERVTGLPRSTIYEKMSRGEFPKPVRISGRAVGWIESEVAEWQGALIEKRNKEIALRIGRAS